jgi:hypothetical protein
MYFSSDYDFFLNRYLHIVLIIICFRPPTKKSNKNIGELRRFQKNIFINNLSKRKTYAILVLYLKKKIMVGFLLAIFVSTISFSLISSFDFNSVKKISISSSNTKLYAKGGNPGPPSDKPKPPDDDEPPAIQYELFIEIDYIEGHKPTDPVLAYIVDYYFNQGIRVTFFVNDEISMLDSYEDGISDDEFWAIEAIYNDGGDKASDGYDYYLKEKWVLFGSSVEGEPNIIGYTWAIYTLINPRKADLLTGNYIFIADGSADEWATNNIEEQGAEAVVLMHEIGHAIGIGIIEFNVFYGWIEVYDQDTYSVMSYLNPNNAGLYNQWYYSNKYWKTRNMQDYKI